MIYLAILIYILIVLIYPICKIFVDSKHLITLYIFALWFILYHYLIMSAKIYISNWNSYLIFSEITIFSNILNLNFSFCLTPLTYSFSILVIIIGSITNLYILNYFKGEADESGFIFWLNSFIISMIVLVLAGNFFTLFLGWELIGLTSFFLINFWQGKRGTLKSSFKAFSFNLISDLCLLSSLVLLYTITGCSDIRTALYLITWATLDNYYYTNIIICLLIICASIKSVQILGHLWLPDSMEAPVPASALIHSATLVSAGIFLLAKFNFIIALYKWNLILIFLGSITAAYGGIVASSQTDMKKILAYSTMSHCGFLLLLVSFSNFHVLIIYLFLHGLFKAATFFCAGSFIRIYNSQDTRLMGSNQSVFITDAILLFICSLNLCGIPFTIGSLYKTFFFKLMLYKFIPLFSLGFIFIGLLTSILYLFQLMFYSIFDIAKSTLQNLYLILEVNNLKIGTLFRGILDILIERVTNSSIFLAIIVILVISFCIYKICTWLYLENIIEVDVSVYNEFLNYFIYTNINSLYNNYFIFFYLIYSVLIVFLLFISYRHQYSWWLKILINFWIFFIIILLAILINKI